MPNTGSSLADLDEMRTQAPATVRCGYGIPFHTFNRENRSGILLQGEVFLVRVEYFGSETLIQDWREDPARFLVRKLGWKFVCPQRFERVPGEFGVSSAIARESYTGFYPIYSGFFYETHGHRWILSNLARPFPGLRPDSKFLIG